MKITAHLVPQDHDLLVGAGVLVAKLSDDAVVLVVVEHGREGDVEADAGDDERRQDELLIDELGPML